jgi:hypothetical protein
MTSTTTTTTTTEGEGFLLKQTLMSHGECFVYKVPPLSSASGYRANDWNLASPLETCGFQVERRNNDLYLLFTLENHTKLFALSKIEGEGSSINNINVETVMDTSRYFVCKILQSNPNDASKKDNNRTALLGFGFRERDIAIDLLGNLQQFKQSIDRELEAKDLASKTKAIPTLADGEKLHIRIPGSMGRSPKIKSSKGSSGGTSTPILLKKPPPGADDNNNINVSPELPPSPYNGGRRFSMSAMECPISSMTLNIGPKTGTTGAIDDQGGGTSAGSAQDDDSAAAQAHTIVDEFLSADDDFDDDDDVNPDGMDDGLMASGDDDESEDAVGGYTVNDDDDSNDSFQFSELNLDDLDENEIDDNKETTTAATTTATKDDDDFGDFQGA